MRGVLIVFSIRITRYALLSLSTTFWADEFWHKATRLGADLQSYADEQLAKIANRVPEINDYKALMTDVIDAAKQFRADLHEISEERVVEEVEKAFAQIAAELQKQFPPPDTAPTHDERLRLVSNVLDQSEHAMLQCVLKLGMDPELATKNVATLRVAAGKVTVIAGDLVELHPLLAEIILVAGACLLVPEVRIMRSLLDLLGFSPAGPVKGSIAAWAQRHFFGATISRKSWFAWLESASMKRGGSGPLKFLKWLWNLILAKYFPGRR